MKKIFILTGEPSGDKLAYEVIKELKKTKKDIKKTRKRQDSYSHPRMWSR